MKADLPLKATAKRGSAGSVAIVYRQGEHREVNQTPLSPLSPQQTFESVTSETQLSSRQTDQRHPTSDYNMSLASHDYRASFCSSQPGMQTEPQSAPQGERCHTVCL